MQNQTENCMSCARCKALKPLASFAKYFTRRGRGPCADCEKKRRRVLYLKNREQMLERLRNARPEKKAAIAARKRGYYRANPDKHLQKAREYRRGEKHLALSLSEFGISVSDYTRLLVVQAGACAICRRPPIGKRLAVDHDHETGSVRGLLCGACNTSIGRLGDTYAGVLNAAAYLAAPLVGTSEGLVL